MPDKPISNSTQNAPRNWLAPALTAASLVVFWVAAWPWYAHPAERFYVVVPWVFASGGLWLKLAGKPRAARMRALASAAVFAGLLGVFLYARGGAPRALADGELFAISYMLVAVILVARWIYLGVYFMVRAGFRVRADASRRRVFAARIVTLVLFSLPLTGYLIAVLQTHFPKLRSSITPKRIRLDYDAVHFITRDGVHLVGWFVPSTGSERTAIVCHGVGAFKADMIDFIAALTEGGYNVLAFDFRGHGESGGHTVSYGAREKLDVRAAIDWIQEEHPQQSRHVVGVGWSMGAATLILTAAEDKRIEALHLDAAYARTRDIAPVFAKPFPPVYRQVGLHIGLLWASVESGTNLYTLAPIDAMARIAPRPIMLVHGSDDRLIPIAQGRALFAAAGEPKSFHEIAGAGHCQTISVDTPDYQRRMLEFLNAALAGERTP